jgi:hypothetical protein
MILTNGGVRMTPDGLFTSSGHDAWGMPKRTLDVALVEAIGASTQSSGTDAEAAGALAEQVYSDLMAFGTGGGEELTEAQMKVALRALADACSRLGVPLELPFRGYATFKNYWLKNDGYGSWQARRVMVGELLDPAIEALVLRASEPAALAIPDAALSALTDPAAIHDSLRRMSRSVDTDPRLAVSTAKDLIESTAKLVVTELQESYSDREDIPALAARAQKLLGLTKRDVGEGRPADEMEALGRLLGSLTGLVQGVAELRNRAGTGHGRASVPTWVQPRHARLASNAATTWCSLILETLGDPEAPWRTRRLE